MVEKETDSSLKESDYEPNNESDSDLMGFACFKYINDYSPFKFNEKLITQKKKKYFAFKFCENPTNNGNLKNNKENSNILNEEKTIKKENSNTKLNIKKEKVENNRNTSFNSYNNFYNRFYPNFGQSIDDMREVEEGEMDSEDDMDNEFNEEEDFDPDFEDDLGIINYDIRNDSCIKTVIMNIKDTYKKINPEYKYGDEEEQIIILTEPSEPKDNNGKDNENKDLIVSKNYEIKNKDITYIIIDLLGTGISGQTFKALCKNDNNYYALKIIKNDPIFAKMSEYEYMVMKNLNENDKKDEYHIIRTHDYFTFNNHLCIVNELMQKTLLDVLKAGLSLTSIRFISRQILKAVDFIHNSNLVHTDLKPENILLSIDNENNNNSNKEQASQNTDLIKNKVTIKIADFGSTCIRENLLKKTNIQSMYYRAPEVIIGLPLNEKVDVWSIGCILIELYLGTPILPGTCSYDQLLKINTFVGECPQALIECSKKGSKYFIRDNETGYYKIKKPNEYYNEYPKEKPNELYQIPKKLRNIDGLIDVKKEKIKGGNSRLKSLNNSSVSVNSTNIRDDLVAFIHLLKGMLQIDPAKRWSCKQCLKHPFITRERLDKFISSEINEINQFMSNSLNYNNKSNIQNNYRSQLNKSFNNYYNINNFGGQINYSFGNFNNNNFNFMRMIQNNQRNSNPNNQINMFPKNENNNMNNNNINNNNLNINNKFNNNKNYKYNMNYNNNYNNQKLNSSFSYNVYQPLQFYNFPSYYPMYNNNMYNNNAVYYNNNPFTKQNSRSFLGLPNQNLNSSYNNNKSQNYSNNIQIPENPNYKENK